MMDHRTLCEECHDVPCQCVVKAATQRAAKLSYQEALQMEIDIQQKIIEGATAKQKLMVDQLRGLQNACHHHMNPEECPCYDCTIDRVNAYHIARTNEADKLSTHPALAGTKVTIMPWHDPNAQPCDGECPNLLFIVPEPKCRDNDAALMDYAVKHLCRLRDELRRQDCILKHNTWNEAERQCIEWETQRIKHEIGMAEMQLEQVWKRQATPPTQKEEDR